MKERFGKDSLIALATVSDGKPYVRAVNSYYEDGCFYVITHELSNKMRHIRENPIIGICGEWFTAQGVGESLGYICANENRELAEKLSAERVIVIGRKAVLYRRSQRKDVSHIEL